jgi:HSP20 family protein
MKDQAKAENSSSVAPLIDVHENDEGYLLVADLPGVTSDQLDISVEKGILHLETKGGDREWQYRRQLRLSDDFDPEGVTAKLEAGVLELVILKRAQARTRKIKVGGA